jgi:hypothetical protein
VRVWSQQGSANKDQPTHSADALSADELAGALIVLAETKDAGKREAWAKRGAAFFQGRSRRTASAPDRDTGGATGRRAIDIRRRGHSMTCAHGRLSAARAPGI